MKTTKQEARNAYRAYLQFSGLSAETFKYRCNSLLHELADGEWAGDVWTPGQWVRAAREIAWVERVSSAKNMAERIKAETAYLKIDLET